MIFILSFIYDYGTTKYWYIQFLLEICIKIDYRPWFMVLGVWKGNESVNDVKIFTKWKFLTNEEYVKSYFQDIEKLGILKRKMCALLKSYVIKIII